MEERKDYCVYLITNLANGKQYVGQTGASVKTRFRAHVNAANSGASYRISNAIRKYGSHSFSVLVLREGLSKEEANEEEKLYIRVLNTQDEDFGYNLAKGGDSAGRVPKSDVPNDELIRLYEQGETIYQLAKKYPMTFTGVGLRLRQAGVKMRNRGYPRTTGIDEKEATRRYLAGDTTAAMASESRVSQATIRRILKEAGVKMRNQGHPRREDVTSEEVVHLYQDKLMSCAQIGKHFGMSWATIRDRLVRLGVKLRPQARVSRSLLALRGLAEN